MHFFLSSNSAAARISAAPETRFPPIDIAPSDLSAAIDGVCNDRSRALAKAPEIDRGDVAAFFKQHSDNSLAVFNSHLFPRAILGAPIQFSFPDFNRSRSVPVLNGGQKPASRNMEPRPDEVVGESSKRLAKH
jgi:hypothetical protein